MVKILLADDHEITREGLKLLLETQAEMMEVVAVSENGRQAVEMALQFKPDIVVMDISMPDMNGIDATRRILSDQPEIKVIALSMYSDRRYVAGMLKAGVSAYLLKDCALEELTQAITTVLKGQVYLSPQITDIAIKDYAQYLLSNDASAASILTDREREVLQLIAEGLTTKKIASTLNVSIKTIESHRRQIMEKLEIRSIAGLTKFALKEGLTSL